MFLAVGVVSVFLGIDSGGTRGKKVRGASLRSPIDTEAVGFFANRNHFAALLYALILFAAAWTGTGRCRIWGAAPRKEI